MRTKAMLAVIASVAIGFCATELSAQVAPAAQRGGFPISIGFGMSGYNLDYGPGRWMEGPVIRAGFGIFHGLGVDVSARSIFMNTPPELTRMQQNTFLAGAFYDGWHKGRVNPFARYAGGIGTIAFPSRNPLYTRDSYTVYATGGGIEYQLTRKAVLRGEYEYQWWKQYHGPRDLNPQGVTLGVNYYLHGRHVREYDQK